MHNIRVINEQQLRACITLDSDIVDVVETAFVALDSGGIVMPPILSMPLTDMNGEVDIKTAYIPGFDGFAIKMSTGFFDNQSRGLPSLGGLMVVFSATTGQVDAVLLDNGYLTDVRTAAAGAVAARHLAPAKVKAATVIGSGLQARIQIRAAHLVRELKQVFVWGRNRETAVTCAADIALDLGCQAEAVTDPAEAIAKSQLVITTTPSQQPVFKTEWLHPGLHITAMGSDTDHKNEIEAEVFAQADLIVCDRVSQCEVLGELRSARQAGFFVNTTPPELGAIIRGVHCGRSSNEDITVCDLTGTGAQDTAIATVALKRARDSGVGTIIET